MDPVLAIALLALAFVATHLALSHPPLRAALVARIDAGPFQAAYSLLALALYGPLAWLWFTHRHAGPALWALRSPGVVRIAEATAATGIALVVAGLAQPVASSLEARRRASTEVRGIAHVTRHPMLMGIALLSAAHLVLNGWLGDVLFWGSNLLLALAGAAHQDLRLRRARPGYAEYAARAPFWPNPAGLTRVGLRGLVAGLVGVALAVAIRAAHRWF